MKAASPSNAALAWSTLGLRWMEMMAASGQVIAYRTQRRNTPAQLFTMGSEKVEAMVESYNAVARHALTWPASSGSINPACRKAANRRTSPALFQSPPARPAASR